VDEEGEEKLRKEEGVEPEGGGGDNSTDRKTRAVVYLVAGGFLLVGGMNVGLYLFQSHHDQTKVSIGRCLYLSIPLVIGLVILIRSSALAQRIDEWLEE
jgi:hypothetical protein